MADVEFETFDDGSTVPVRVSARAGRFLGMAGALTSVALVVGLGYWGYRLAVRDVTGVPVVRALEGPMRVAPDDPGGQITANQGLSVNLIAADGGISAPADRLVLAPAPVGILADDQAGTAVAMVAPVSGRASDNPGLGIAEMPEMPQGNAPIIAASFDENSDINALADALSEGAVPLSGDVEQSTDTGPKPHFIFAKGALMESPRPRARPAGNVQIASAPAEVPEINGETLAPGTRLVQLGAYDGEDVARKEWERLAGRFGDLMHGKTRIVQSAKSGGRTFYRLRAMGFADDMDSRRFCAALVAENAACIPVVVR
ncbi:SPOR domain-containing protein [Pseudorhodobacter sp.]|uniref:SPOR domain-containing protein n=1 Tax=Pseudorhodobacter sp. TaxID=1934400 RepID=UPI002647ABA4|nr:SPOR domain-containing protein [Pseudorhodobacter sp.]MDN5787553.1 SPOR domain-containing protein [Pseudorhodobacter sp.]